MGQADDGIYLVETEADVERLQVPEGVSLAYVTQTTLSVDDCRTVIEALRRRFPQINEPKKQDICYATQNRQDAVKFMAPQCDLVLIIGSPSSSNSNRLREVAERHGCEVYLIGSAAQLNPVWLEERKHVGISTGASTPEILVDEVYLRQHLPQSCFFCRKFGFVEHIMILLYTPVFTKSVLVFNFNTHIL